MAIRFLLDENMELAVLRAAVRHNDRKINAVSITRVGETGAPPFGTPDPEILTWAEQHGWIVVSHDRNTMPGHLKQHLAAGRHLPGILIAKRRQPLMHLVEMLVIIAHATEPAEWAD